MKFTCPGPCRHTSDTSTHPAHPLSHAIGTHPMEERMHHEHHEHTPSTDPAGWWRHLCWVTDRLALCGDLSHDRDLACNQLVDWQAAGVTHIIDVRAEWSDESLVTAEAPELTYHWLGADDHGGTHSGDWFDSGVGAVRAAFEDPDAKVVIHCHMGVNRAPSMGLAVLVALGWEPLEALEAIRAARPIAAVLYADDAISWALRNAGCGDTEIMAARRRVRRWLRENPVDVSWVISRIRIAERSA
jgi:dual specificity phosphatase 3